METLSQRDPRWAKKHVGFGSKTFAQVGCTVTALTMLLNRLFKYSLTPDEVNIRLKAVKAFSDGSTNGVGKGNLIVWYRVPYAFPELKWSKRVKGYRNVEVALYVYAKRTPVMVEVDAKSIGAPRHWVLYLGFQKMADPWTGTEKSTKAYPPTGYSLFDKA